MAIISSVYLYNMLRYRAQGLFPSAIQFPCAAMFHSASKIPPLKTGCPCSSTISRHCPHSRSPYITYNCLLYPFYHYTSTLLTLSSHSSSPPSPPKSPTAPSASPQKMATASASPVANSSISALRSWPKIPAKIRPRLQASRPMISPLASTRAGSRHGNVRSI